MRIELEFDYSGKDIALRCPRALTPTLQRSIQPKTEVILAGKLS